MIALTSNTPFNLNAVPEAFRNRLVEWYAEDEEEFLSRYSIAYAYDRGMVCIVILLGKGEGTQAARATIVRMFDIGGKVALSVEGQIEAEEVKSHVRHW